MGLELTQELEYNYSEFRRLWSHELYYNALTWLAENYIYVQEANSFLKKKWIDSIKKVSLTKDMIRDISTEAYKEMASIYKIVSVIREFEYEELVLVLTKRVGLGTVVFLLKEQFDIELGVELGGVDKEIKDILRCKANVVPFRQAVSRLKESYRNSFEVVAMLDGINRK